MNMPIPAVGIDPGPDWATNLNNCLTIVDSHDHSTGSGVPITPSGMNISSDLTFGGNNAIGLRSVRLNIQGSPLAGAQDLNCLYDSGVDLYFNDGNGNQIRITQSGGVAGTPGSIANLVPPASASYVSANQTFVWQSDANTSANLDAGSVIFRNVTASSHGITMSAPIALGSDYTLTLPALPSSQKIMTLDNAGLISAPYTVDNSTLTIVANVIGVPAGGIGTTQLANGAVTPAKMSSDALAIGSSYRNFLYNGGFDFWQRGTTNTAANGATRYVSDRWYVKNSLGTAGVITFAQVAGSVAGSKFGASVKITNPPSAAQANGCELYQTLDNESSLDLLGKSASVTAQIKALGNVNQVGIQFYYATSEAKVTTAIGSEQLVTVNSSTFSLGSLLAQTLTAATITTAGVVGVRIRITAVSSGNTYDVNNGFIVEQVGMNIASGSIPFLRQGSGSQAELALCQRFYEKSYDITTNPATSTSVGASGMSVSQAGAATNNLTMTVFFKSAKRSASTVTLFDIVGNSAAVTTNIGNNASGVAAFNLGQNSFNSGALSGSGAVFSVTFHWTAEAEI